MDAAEGEFLKEAERKRKRVYSDGESRDIRPRGITEAQKTVLALSAENEGVRKAVFSVLSPEEFENGVYRKLAERICEDAKKGVRTVPGDLISCFDNIEEQNTAAAVFAVKTPAEDMGRLEKAVTENVRLIKKSNMESLLDKASTAEEVKRLIDAKRKLDGLYITISDS